MPFTTDDAITDFNDDSDPRTSVVRDIAVEGIVVLQDAETLQERAKDRYVGELVSQQLREADLLILNKVDLLAPQALDDLRTWLTSQSPGLPVVAASHGRVPPELVLGLSASGKPGADRPAHGLSAGETDADRPTDSNGDDAALSRWADRSLHTTAASAADLFASQTLRFDAPVDLSALIVKLSAPGSGVLRAKGLLTDLDGQRKTLQLAGRRAELSPAPAATSNTAPDRLLVIRLAHAPVLQFPP